MNYKLKPYDIGLALVFAYGDWHIIFKYAAWCFGMWFVEILSEIIKEMRTDK